MREIDLIDLPFRRVGDFLGPLQTDPEKSDLVSEGFAFGGLQITGVVPPFDAEIVVRKMVARKIVFIPRQGRTKCGRFRSLS